MNKKGVLGLVFIILFSVLDAQDVHPNKVRKAVYDVILNDVLNLKKSYINKEIYIDATVNKFDDVLMNSYGVQLSDPEYVNDEEFCKILQQSKCVEKLAIDQFTLSKVYQNHKDENYVDFYGIYAPLDHWYSVIHNTFQYLLQNDKPNASTIIIPVKNVYFKNGEIMTNHFFYQFNLDNEFKIKSYQKINF